MTESTLKRCPWSEINERNRIYHDNEWGVPSRDDRHQFEHLCMEVLQGGLSWDLMLSKRDIFKGAFAQYDIDQVAAFNDEDVARIMEIEGMIRSERKIKAIISNAKALQGIIEKYGSFSDYLWAFTDGQTLIYRDHHDLPQPPSKNALSDYISRELKKEGLSQIGPVCIYAHLQACGLINDHHPECFRYHEVTRYGSARYLTEENNQALITRHAARAKGQQTLEESAR